MTKSRILIKGAIHTFNPENPIAEAVIIRDGLFLQTGSSEEIIALKENGCIVEDLEGQTVIPAFTDAHVHLLEYGFSLLRLDCETDTLEECLERIRQRTAETPPGKWILGHGWNHNIWPEGFGNKQMLDEITTKHPIYLSQKALHSGWANSAALEAAGITKDIEDPQGGEYQRDAQGELTGILIEAAARVMEKAIPRPDRSECIRALSAAQERLLQLGITCVHDFDIWDCYPTLEEMEKQDLLKIRVIKSIPFSFFDEAIEIGLKSGMGSDHLTIGCLKLFADGALSSQTAAMFAPFENTNSTGMLLLDSDEIVKIGQKAYKNEISLAIHAIGDRANREVLDGFEQLGSSGCPLKSRIEHVQLIQPQDIRRMASLGIVASMQPIHMPSDRDIADEHWGDRSQYAYAWKTIQKSGVDIVFGSDAPVESPNPFWGLYAALARKAVHPNEDRASWYPQERLNLSEALEAYITKPHDICGWSQKLGRIKSGYIADLIILPQGFYHMSPEEFHDLLPSKVMCDGDWVI